MQYVSRAEMEARVPWHEMVDSQQTADIKASAHLHHVSDVADQGPRNGSCVHPGAHGILHLCSERLDRGRCGPR